MEINIKPSILKWAREEAGYDIEEIQTSSESIGITYHSDNQR